ncbi:MAG: branched-chain amino acid transport system substrate-binding protein [Limisphaerales bacterium]|nr:MAG: branched-chain amino acid transport system substrate-binding protein [Limisphaerales bacterium]KAG0507933.1 MAG: branched-chain amino acid transport system substrate-binding protein [Limisphaerales bacterium]TXT48355.1 MAG: branched-chain amino acid transport system substrate-binding protein [Limisphaerales bacterium]
MKAQFTRRHALAALAVSTGSFLTACKKPEEAGKGGDGGKAASGDVIKVGEFASLTGKEATFGQSSHKGTLLAIEELNAAGGVLGKKLELITEDTQSKQGESASVVRKLVSRDKCIAILGEVASGRSLEAAPICQNAKVPMISPSSTNPKVTEVGDFVFRVCFIDPFQGTVMALFAKNTLRAKNVAVLTDAAAPYSVGLATFFKEKFVADGGKIAVEQKFSSGDKDFKAQLTAIKASNPEAIFAPCYYTEAGLIAQQARQLGINLPIFGGDGWEAPELVTIGGKAMDGTFYSTHYSPEDKAEMVQTFVKKFKARWNGEVPDAMAALGYDSALVLADAIKRAGGTDGQKLRDALAATKDFVGVTGKTTLDAKRNATKPAVIIEVKDGKFVYKETVNP